MRVRSFGFLLHILEDPLSYLLHLRASVPCSLSENSQPGLLGHEDRNEGFEGAVSLAIPGSIASSVHDHPWNDFNTRPLHCLAEPVHHMLQYLVARPSVGSYLFLHGNGPRHPETSIPLCICPCNGLDLLGLLDGPLVLRLSLVLPDVDEDLGFREPGLLFGPCHGLPELTFLDGGEFLLGIGLNLLNGDLPVPELGQDKLDPVVPLRWDRGPDEHLLQLEVIVCEP